MTAYQALLPACAFGRCAPCRRHPHTHDAHIKITYDAISHSTAMLGRFVMHVRVMRVCVCVCVCMCVCVCVCVSHIHTD